MNNKNFFTDELKNIEEMLTLEGLEELESLPEYDEQPEFIFIDGSDDPFGINDIMCKMDEILAERYGLFDDCAEDKPIILDYTQLSEDEMHELIKEAAACVELENELAYGMTTNVERTHYFS